MALRAMVLPTIKTVARAIISIPAIMVAAVSFPVTPKITADAKAAVQPFA